jgi:hypothetical protein
LAETVDRNEQLEKSIDTIFQDTKLYEKWVDGTAEGNYVTDGTPPRAVETIPHLMERLDTEFRTLKTKLDSDVTALKNTLNSQAQALFAQLQGESAAMSLQIQTAIDTMSNHVAAQVSVISNKAEADIAALKSKLSSDVSALTYKLNADATALYNKLDAQVTARINTLKAEAAALMLKLEGDVNELMRQLSDKFNILLEILNERFKVMTIRGVWEPDTEYYLNDVVRSPEDGSYWISGGEFTSHGSIFNMDIDAGHIVLFGNRLDSDMKENFRVTWKTNVHVLPGGELFLKAMYRPHKASMLVAVNGKIWIPSQPDMPADSEAWDYSEVIIANEFLSDRIHVRQAVPIGTQIDVFVTQSTLAKHMDEIHDMFRRSVIASKNSRDWALKAQSVYNAHFVAVGEGNTAEGWVTEFGFKKGHVFSLPIRYLPGKDVLFFFVDGALCVPRKPGIDDPSLWSYKECRPDRGSDSTNRIVLGFDIPAGTPCYAISVVSGLTRHLDLINAAKARAVQAQEASKESEINAKASEEASALSEFNAKQSEDAASISEANAEESASQALAAFNSHFVSVGEGNARQCWLADEDIEADSVLTLPLFYFPGRDSLALWVNGALCMPRKPGLEESARFSYEEIEPETDDVAYSQKVRIFFEIKAGDSIDAYALAYGVERNIEAMTAFQEAAELAADSAEDSSGKAEAAKERSEELADEILAAYNSTVASVGEGSARQVWEAEKDYVPGDTLTLPVVYYPGRDSLVIWLNGAVMLPRKPSLEDSGAWNYDELPPIEGADYSVRVLLNTAIAEGDRIDAYSIAYGLERNLQTLTGLKDSAETAAGEAAQANEAAQDAKARAVEIAADLDAAYNSQLASVGEGSSRQAWVAESDIEAGEELALPIQYYPGRDSLIVWLNGAVLMPRKPGLEGAGTWNYEEIPPAEDSGVEYSTKIRLNLPVKAGDGLDVYCIAFGLLRLTERLEATADSVDVVLGAQHAAEMARDFAEGFADDA